RDRDVRVARPSAVQQIRPGRRCSMLNSRRYQQYRTSELLSINGIERTIAAGPMHVHEPRLTVQTNSRTRDPSNEQNEAANGRLCASVDSPTRPSVLLSCATYCDTTSRAHPEGSCNERVRPSNPSQPVPARHPHVYSDGNVRLRCPF